jgi:DnaJ-class molecular chaperone
MATSGDFNLFYNMQYSLANNEAMKLKMEVYSMGKNEDYIEETWTDTCAKCGGSGLEGCPICVGEGNTYDMEVCDYCDGEGYVECSDCDGKGKATYHMGQVVK